MNVQLAECANELDRPAVTLEPPVVPNTTLPAFVLAQADRRGDQRALVDAMTGRELSYSDLSAAVRAVAIGLLGRGVQPGHVLAVCAPNSIEFIVTWYAASSIGAIVTTINPASTREEIVRLLLHSGARWLLCTAELFDEKVSAAARAAAIRESFVIGAVIDEMPGAVHYESLCGHGRQEAPSVAVDPSDVAFLPTSSGTTGLPKHVMLTHRNLVASLCQTRLVHRVTRDDVVLAALPLFHIFGFQATLNLALLEGATVVVLPRFTLDAFLRAVQRYRVTRAEVVPPIVLTLANSAIVDEYDLSSLRVLTAGGAPLAADCARACARRLGCRVKQGYGMTELAGATHLAPDGGPDRPDSIGPALPGVECRVVDVDMGSDLGPGEPGELLIRSAGAMRGYLTDLEATAATIDVDGWVRTGDIVTCDASGWFHVVDRAKELIKYKGFQVAPAELEAILLTHPAVADAAVVRSPDETAGEVPKAFIVRAASASAEELTTWVAERVAPYKRVRRVEFIDRIPKSPSGKILRRLLVERDRRRQDELDLTGTVALVSGGGRGLGRLIAQRLARHGASVALLARSRNELAVVVQEIERAGGVAVAAVADITDEAATTAALAEIRERLGHIGLLVNNAGVAGPVGQLWELDLTSWWRVIEVNLGGSFTLTRMVLPDMIAQGRGRIINITSNAGVYRWPLMSSYVASKAALVKLTETLATETRPYGVSIFSVDPGLLPLGLSDAALGRSADAGTAEGRVFSWIRDRLASGHGADPQRAVRLIVELAHGRGDRLSGRHLTVADNLDTLIEHIDEIERDDLHTLRLRSAELKVGDVRAA
jgi:acyl-CoA synthetase (AMP-forming)/AMP-acid ligase II/NAD(P)-dependent dehydrogenase (short-subunit alcohol dehydrogenase family)